jgi:hypothetical protein
MGLPNADVHNPSHLINIPVPLFVAVSVTRVPGANVLEVEGHAMPQSIPPGSILTVLVPVINEIGLLRVRVVGVITVTLALGVADTPSCETVMDAILVPAVKVHWKALSVLPTCDPATRVPPVPHCGFVKVTVPVAVPPVRVAVKLNVS